ncbi:hypothetical protein ACNHYB_13315 [Isoptericola jiangsuensis]|uniref:hypothetical protein n=1 Tax=Isoptericola jiangsuensis TaxID=548579 RepID=UPI003AAB6029
MPRTATAELVAAVAARPDVSTVRFTWNQTAPSVLDVLDGAEVRVSPWVQAADGWSVP